MLKIRLRLLPLTVRMFDPGPLMVTLLFVIGISPFASVIVQALDGVQDGKLKLISKCPGKLFAVVIASRRVQVPPQVPVPESPVLLTTRLPDASVT